jgi:hypothetical protein
MIRRAASRFDNPSMISSNTDDSINPVDRPIDSTDPTAFSDRARLRTAHARHPTPYRRSITPIRPIFGAIHDDITAKPPGNRVQ